MAFSEVFSALQQGVVDGPFNTWNNMHTQKFHEVQGYATSSDGAVVLLYGVATNAQWWDGLDSRTRHVLFDALKEATKYGNELAAEEKRVAFEKIKASGRLEIRIQTPEEAALWRVAGEQVQRGWVSQGRVSREALRKDEHGGDDHPAGGPQPVRGQRHHQDAPLRRDEGGRPLASGGRLHPARRNVCAGDKPLTAPAPLPVAGPLCREGFVHPEQDHQARGEGEGPDGDDGR